MGALVSVALETAVAGMLAQAASALVLRTLIRTSSFLGVGVRGRLREREQRLLQMVQSRLGEGRAFEEKAASLHTKAKGTRQRQRAARMGERASEAFRDAERLEHDGRVPASV